VYRDGIGNLTIEGGEIKAGGTAGTTRGVWLANATTGTAKLTLKGSPKVTVASGALGIYLAYWHADARVVLDSGFTLPAGQSYRLARSGATGAATAGAILVEGGAKYASSFVFGGSGSADNDQPVIRNEDLVNTTATIEITGAPTGPFNAGDELKLTDLTDMVVTATYTAGTPNTAVVNHAYLSFSETLPYTFTAADAVAGTKVFTVATFGSGTPPSATFTVTLNKPDNLDVTINIGFGGPSDPDDIAILPFALSKLGTKGAPSVKELTVTGDFDVKWFIDGADVSSGATNGGKDLELKADDFEDIGTYTLRVEATTKGDSPVTYMKTTTFTVTL
jgi:hypothetical protein